MELTISREERERARESESEIYQLHDWVSLICGAADASKRERKKEVNLIYDLQCFTVVWTFCYTL
jgi:hypothetical protein